MRRVGLSAASLVVILLLSANFSLTAQAATDDETVSAPAGTVNPESILRELQNDVLKVYIHARIIGLDDVVVWNMQMDELTVPGRGVQVRLNGENLVVEVEFTPYRQEEESIMLVAQGQTWVKNSSDNKLSYQTSLKSIPISVDEPVIFYPLGMDSENGENLNLELEITISRYSFEETPQGAPDGGSE